MKLNLGCGPKWKEQYPDYEGLDILDYDQTYQADVRYFRTTKQYDEVMANHFLEHFDQEELKKIFKLIHQILKPKGIFKFAVPHMRKERSWILSHKTFWNETTANWLGEEESDTVYGFGRWKVLEVVVNDRDDMHVRLEAIK